MGWGGSDFFLAGSQSRLYPHMRAKFGRDPTAASKKVAFKFISRSIYIFILNAYFCCTAHGSALQGYALHYIKSMLLCYQGGEVKGFNDEALQQIIKFFVLKPADRGVDLRPYLADEEAPVDRGRLINHKGDDIIEQPPIGRWQYPRNPVYF